MSYPPLFDGCVRGEAPHVQGAYSMSDDKPKAPKELDAIADAVLSYRPKPKSTPAKKRKKLAKKLAKADHKKEQPIQ